MKDECLIALAYDKRVRIYVSRTTNLVEEARRIHNTLPTASAALGRFMTASLMMSLMYKDGERLKLKIAGSGPIEQMICEVDFGVIRSYISNPDVYIVYEDGPKKGKLNVGASVGSGFLHVTKDYNQNFFTSSSPLQTGEIGDDFTYYYTVSEQTPSAVGLGVLVKNTQEVIQSGGFIVQVLPECDDVTISMLEETISKMPSFTTLLENKNSLTDILSILSNNTYQLLETHELSYKCGCSKEYYANILKTLDEKTLKEFRDVDHGAEIVCQYCKKIYHYSEKDIELMLLEKK